MSVVFSFFYCFYGLRSEINADDDDDEAAFTEYDACPLGLIFASAGGAQTRTRSQFCCGSNSVNNVQWCSFSVFSALAAAVALTPLLIFFCVSHSSKLQCYSVGWTIVISLVQRLQTA